MNQTITINISGIVFHIEVDAYDTLKNYLNKIKGYFNNSDEREEIMTDIESRVAELFTNMMSDKNQVIVSENVNEVIAIMGKPEDYISEEDEFNTEEETKYRSDKKFFRNPDERALAGVASGIAAYFGFDTIWARLFFVLATIFWGFGIPLYIILWIVIPKAKTASEKLKMRGKPINIENIGRSFESEANKVNEKIKNIPTSKFGLFLEDFFNALGDISKSILKILVKIIGFAFIALGVFLAISFIAGVSGSEMIISLSSEGIYSIKSSDFFNLIFISEDHFYLAVFGIVLMIGIPIISLIYFGLKMLFKIKTHYSVGISLILLWIIGLAISLFTGMKFAADISSKEKVLKTNILPSNFNTFNLISESNDLPGNEILEGHFSGISLDEKYLYWNNVKLSIHKSKNDSTEIKVYKYSNGESKKSAKYKAKSIQYEYSVLDSTINFDHYLSTLKDNKIRGQEVRIHLYLPVGKSVYLDPSISEVMYDIDNTTDTWDKHMIGKKWVMLPNGLTCLDCDDIDGTTSEELSKLFPHLYNTEMDEPVIK